VQLSFVETMTGTLRDGAGREHPVSFDVSARGRGVGHFDLLGVLSAPPWAAETSAEGTLTISLLRGSIAYRLWFTAADRRRLRLEAEKTPSLLRPISSMTFMPAEIQDSVGQVLGRGSMTFDLNDLLPFLASWLPGPRHQQRRLDVRRRAIDRQLLGRPVLHAVSRDGR